MVRGILLIVLLTASAASAQPAQPPRDARLLVTVVDQSNAVIPGATVTATGLETATKALASPPVKTADNGAATLADLLPGRYTILAEFPGFEPGRLADVRLRRGDNKHVIVLAIKGMEESVLVAQDPQAAAADPRGNSFKTVLTPDEIEALSDDPDEMMQQLLDLAGGTAVIRVDSFLGAPLPPKAQIKSIHIVRDQFAAENHSAESEGIDIITQPGTGPLRASFNSRFRDGAMSGKSPFTSRKGPEQTRRFDGNVGGTLVKNKSSFSLSAGSNWSYDTPIVNVALPGGLTRSEVMGLRRPNDNWFAHGLVDYVLTRNHMLRGAFDVNNGDRRNLGVGDYNLTERAYATQTRDREIRLLEVGPIGRRMFANTRLQLEWNETRSRSALEIPTIRVHDAFTSGGAQVAGGRRERVFEAASDIDYIRGLHTVRFGTLVEGGHYRSDDASNYLGTFVFTSLEDFEAKRAATYTRRIGDPLIEYWFVRTGVYVQDDLRIRKNLTLSPGLRYEAQTHLSDYGNLGPRFGLTWSPGKNGRTTVRGSWGIFYNWLSQNTYEQTLRVDGFRQQEMTIVDPSFPDPGDTGAIGATNRYLLDPAAQMVRVMRVSAGVDRTLSPMVRGNVSFSSVRNAHVLHGLNLNAPAGGVRPDPQFANVIETTSEAEGHNDQLTTAISINLRPTRPRTLPLWDWRRLTTRLTYWIAESTNNADGPFVVSPSGALATEWGPANGDRRHRFNAAFNTQALRDLNASLNLTSNSGTPYTVTTGIDENGDTIFNDRPAGVGRGTLRTVSQWTWNANASYTIRMGPPMRAAAQEHAHEVRGATPANGRYRLSFNVNVTNVTNHSNYSGFSGVMTSPFFQQATAVSNPRKVDFSLSFGF